MHGDNNKLGGNFNDSFTTALTSFLKAIVYNAKRAKDKAEKT